MAMRFQARTPWVVENVSDDDRRWLRLPENPIVVPTPPERVDVSPPRRVFAALFRQADERTEFRRIVQALDHQVHVIGHEAVRNQVE